MSLAKIELMLTACLRLACLLALSGTLCAQEPSSAPADPNAAVIQLFYVDAGRPAEPELTVFANGRVCARVGSGEIWGSLEQRELRSLLDELLRADGLANLTTDAVARELAAESQRTGLSTQFANAGNTVIVVRAEQAAYRIEAHAVGLSANRFPQAASVQKIAAAQARLENVRAVTMVGGTQAAEKLAQQAARQAANAQGGNIEISSRDLCQVRSLADGSRYCQFLVRPADPAAQPGWIVSLIEAPGVPPQVTVLPDGQRRQ